MAREIQLVVDGKTVPLNPFVSQTLAGTVTGFISGLKKVDPNGEIVISIKKKPDGS